MIGMEPLLTILRALAEPTRLRLLALARTGAFCVADFTAILGQSQPRLSRQLRLLCEAGLLTRERDGTQVWFHLGEAAAGPVGALLDRLPKDDPALAADAREAARLLADRARIASERFRAEGADWDEMRALDLPAAAVEKILLEVVPASGTGRLLDIGTGTGRALELLAPRIGAGVGVDASPAMLALARARLARAGVANCSVRRADMYRLPFADESFDAAVLQMVLHHAEQPQAVLAEAARVVRPSGLLIVVELTPHGRGDVTSRLGHRWAGFERGLLHNFLTRAGFSPAGPIAVEARMPLMVWRAVRFTAATPRIEPAAEARIF